MPHIGPELAKVTRRRSAAGRDIQADFFNQRLNRTRLKRHRETRPTTDTPLLQICRSAQEELSQGGPALSGLL